MIPHGHMVEVVGVAAVGIAGTVGALILQTGSPAAALQAVGAVASSIPDSFWITAAVIVAVRLVISSQIKKLVELPPKQAIFDAIGNVEKLVKEYHVILLAEIATLRKDGLATDKRVDTIEAAKKLEVGIGAALKAAKDHP